MKDFYSWFITSAQQVLKFFVGRCIYEHENHATRFGSIGCSLYDTFGSYLRDNLQGGYAYAFTCIPS
jgi:hypothetical protein